MIKDIELALSLKKVDKLEESNNMLLKIWDKYPENAYLNYQIAWSYDLLGKETNAIPFYEKAINQGLEELDLQEAYLGLESTYRVTGDYEKSYELFKLALKEFPENKALKVFYSMTLYNLNHHEETTKILLQLLGNHLMILNNLKKLFYSDKLNQILL